MDARELIESGLLELYVTGALSEQETRQVESMRDNADVARELEAIERSLESYAKLHARKPQRDLLAEAKTRIAADDSNTSPAESARIRSIGITVPRWAAIAASILVVASLALAIFSYTEYRQEFATREAAQKRIAALETELDDMGVKMAVAEEDRFILAHEMTSRVNLAGTDMRPTAKALVFWNSAVSAVYVSPLELIPTDEAHQYQLWALKDGLPIDAGVFDMANEVVRLKDVSEVDAFAVTIEPRGGSVNPTLDQMVLIGEV